MAPDGDGRLEVFNFAIDGSLWRIVQTIWSGDWSGWIATPSGGFTEWPAAIARNGDGRLITFAVRSDLEQIEQTNWSNGWSSGWTSLGGPGGTIITPTVTAGADGRLVLFATSAANGPPSLWRLEQSVWGGSWNPTWFPHFAPEGQLITGPPVMILDAQGQLQVFVLSDTGEMWNIGQTGPAGAWTDWNSLGSAGGGFDDRPAVAASADGRLELFVRGIDNKLWHAWQIAVGGAWSGWVSFDQKGLTFQDHPAVATNADGRLELFMTGRDNWLWHAWQVEASGKWLFWSRLGNSGGFVNGPAVAPSGDRRFEVFVVGSDGALHHIWQTQASSNEWSGWISHGAPP
jgi:hypothetical protein